jgi:hypothetical protein
VQQTAFVAVSAGGKTMKSDFDQINFTSATELIEERHIVSQLGPQQAAAHQ